MPPYNKHAGNCVLSIRWGLPEDSNQSADEAASETATPSNMLGRQKSFSTIFRFESRKMRPKKVGGLPHCLFGVFQ